MAKRRLWTALLAASVLQSVSAMPALGQAMHRYVRLGETTLPEPGAPLAVVFIDVGASVTQGGLAQADVVYALSPSQPIGGAPTTHAIFRYQASCAASTLQVRQVSSYATGTAAKVTASDEAAHAPAPDTLDGAILAALCRPAPPGGYPTLDATLRHAADYAVLRRATDGGGAHRLVVAGPVDAGLGGRADVFMDVAGVTRAGNIATAPVVEVFQRPLSAGARPGNYTVGLVDYDCKAGVHARLFTILYQPRGDVLAAGLVENQPRPVRPGSVDDKLLRLACDGVDPGYGAAQPSLALALRVAWKDLSATKPR